LTLNGQQAELVERLAATTEGSAERRQLRYHLDLLDDVEPDPMRQVQK